ncbi:MAG: hypothetical protein IT355_16460 [Gemmatimonadaceae bacterium]|nr:hypothetical protein [Gemmatimonadaceae bacterium]
MTGNAFGKWVRPVSSRGTEELSIDERRYEDGQDVKLLDLVEVAFKEPRPHACQVENHLIDDEHSWIRRGTIAASTLLPAAIASGPLWVDGFSSYGGENDRIPQADADQLPSSLILVVTEAATFEVGSGFKKRQVRIRFRLGNRRYLLSVTDPKVETDYLGKPDGEYSFETRALVCVSLGEPFDGYRYKLVAGFVPI